MRLEIIMMHVFYSKIPKGILIVSSKERLQGNLSL